MTSKPQAPHDPRREQNWIERLNEHCRSIQASEPVFNMTSDRRGSRNAWTSVVNIASLKKEFPARYWYDGLHVDAAKQDAAEVAVRTLQEPEIAGRVYEERMGGT